MSYILDALKKADTERERHAVPGLHAQADAGVGTAERRGGMPWRWLALAVIGVVLAAALFAWIDLGGDEVPAPAATAPMPAPAPTPAPAPQPAAPPQAAAPAPMPAPPPAVTPPPPPIQEPIAHIAPPPAAAAAPPKAPASSAEARLPSRNELPPELRAALPALQVSGAVYAPQASGRMLFVNGLVLREGDAVADGLTVERIGASASVLVFRGQRFELKH